jgi:hypothetical protein
MHLGGTTAYRALEFFAQQNMSSFLSPEESPALSAAIDDLWKEWPSGKWRAAAGRVEEQLRRLRNLAGALPKRFAGDPLLSDLEPYLSRLKELACLGQAAVTALRNGERCTQRLAKMLQAARKDTHKICGEIIQTFSARVQELTK